MKMCKNFIGLGVVCSLCWGCVLPASGAATQTAAGAASDGEGPNAGMAWLLGPVRFLDGADAPNNGAPIEIAPGCHRIQTSGDMIVQQAEVVIRAQITPADIVILAKAGFRYVVERQVLDQSASMSDVRIFAREEDAQHHVIQVFLPVHDAEQLNACRPNVGPAN